MKNNPKWIVILTQKNNTFYHKIIFPKFCPKNRLKTPKTNTNVQQKNHQKTFIKLSFFLFLFSNFHETMKWIWMKKSEFFLFFPLKNVEKNLKKVKKVEKKKIFTFWKKMKKVKKMKHIKTHFIKNTLFSSECVNEL